MGARGRDGRWDRFHAEGLDGGGLHGGGLGSTGLASGGPESPRRGPRWLVPLRVVVVILAMVAAALGVLWVESAGVQGATEQVDAGRPVAIPPLNSTPSGGTPDAPAAVAPPGTAAPPTPASGEAVLVVHVAGAVATPGVFLLPAGSRVFEAVEKAGGALPTAELTALNLAAALADGTQVFIPTVEQAAGMGPGTGSGQQAGSGTGPAAAGGGGGPPEASGPGQPLNLNAASAAQLEELPGLGPVLAQRIVQWRTDHGPFATVDGLEAVPGIGAKLLAGLRDLVVAP